MKTEQAREMPGATVKETGKICIKCRRNCQKTQRGENTQGTPNWSWGIRTTCQSQVGRGSADIHTPMSQLQTSKAECHGRTDTKPKA